MNIGDKMPDVLGTDQNGKEVKISDYQGKKIVLFVYSKDNTSGCTAEACSFRDHKADFDSKNCVILGVSKDSAKSHLGFIEKQGLNFDLIADTETTLLQTIGAWGEKKRCGKVSVGAIRTTYIIGENGVVEAIMNEKEIKTKEHATQILALL